MTVTSGTAIPPFEVPSVSVEAMKTMAVLLRDPNPIHWDVAAIKELGMGDRVINQGPTNMAYVVNMLIAWTGDPSHIQKLNFRFLDNVRAGDHVIAGGIVTDVLTEDGRQLAHCDVWLDVVDGPRALSGTAVVTL
jgi:acyl dehydratase